MWPFRFLKVSDALAITSLAAACKRSISRVGYILLTAIYFFCDFGGRRSCKIFGVWEVVLFGESHEDFGGIAIETLPIQTFDASVR